MDQLQVELVSWKESLGITSQTLSAAKKKEVESYFEKFLAASRR